MKTLNKFKNETIELNADVTTSKEFTENFTAYNKVIQQLTLDLKNKIINADQFHLAYTVWTSLCFPTLFSCTTEEFTKYLDILC